MLSETISLPFEFSNQSISEWLVQFQSSDVLLMSNEVYKVLAILNSEYKKIDPAALAIIMMRLTPVVMTLSATLEKAIIKHSQGRKVAKMSIRLLYHLAFLHAHLAKKIVLKRDKALHVNYAVQIGGVILLHCALNYERPSSVLWDCVAECYELASHEDLLDISVTSPLADFQALPTISLALKRLLLFCLANPHRLDQDDILSLFGFCTENSFLVHFVAPDIPAERVFCWDYSEGSRYQPVYARPDKLPEACVLFNTQALMLAENKRDLDIEGADLVIAVFDQYRLLFENTQFTLSKPYVFVSGFEQVLVFFNKHVRQHQILAINTPTPKDINFSSLALVKEEPQSEPVIDKVSSTDIWNHKVEVPEKVKFRFGALKLVKTPQSLFFIAEAMELKLILGDIFIYYDADLNVALGITRHVELQQSGTIQKSVVEVCLGHVSLLQQARTNSQALLLENNAQHELFLVSGKYALDTVLQFDQVEVVLERLLEVSAKFMRYAVSVRELEV